MEQDQRVEEIRRKAQALADELTLAGEEGVPAMLILPMLMDVFRSAGMIPDGATLSNLVG